MDLKSCLLYAVLAGTPMLSGGAVAQVEPAPAQIPPAEKRELTTLDTVVVSGVQPGPGMWYVTKGGHELWILGSFSPLPSGIDWDASTVNDILSKTQEVVWRPRFVLDMKAGLFRKLYLGYRFSKAQRNPDGKTLSDVLPPAIYDRWVAAKSAYMPRNREVERKRPLLAAEELFKAALESRGLVDRPVIWPKVESSIEEYGITSTTPTVKVLVADPTAALREAQGLALDDASCLEATLDAIDKDLPRMVSNANAWSTSNIDQIDLRQLRRRELACADAFSNNELSKKLGVPDINHAMNDEVMRTLEAALDRNETTVAILPLVDVLGDSGFVAKLRARGYIVEDPAIRRPKN